MLSSHFERGSPSLPVGRHQLIIRKNNITFRKLRPIGGFKSLHRLGAGMRRMRRLVFKDEKMHEASGIVLLLPCLIKLGAGLIGADIGDELRDRALDPRAVVLTGRHASLDAIGRLVYSVRSAAQDVLVFDYRAAVPDTGASTVFRLGSQPIAARDLLLTRLDGSAR